MLLPAGVGVGFGGGAGAGEIGVTGVDGMRWGGTCWADARVREAARARVLIMVCVCVCLSLCEIFMVRIGKNQFSPEEVFTFFSKIMALKK